MIFFVSFLWQHACAQPPQVPPCTDNCLSEALAGNPVKGCTVGTVWVPWPVENPRDACRPCPKGFYCPAVSEIGVNINRKVACPIGTYVDSTGAEQLSHCLDCPAGFYQDWRGRSSCKACPAGSNVSTPKSVSVRDCKDCLPGHYCPSGSPLSTPCPAGTYTKYPKMRALENCLPCLAGHFCPEGTDFPIACPGGSYANSSGHEMTCDVCPPGFFCPEGSVFPTSCPPGSTSGSNASKQSDCMECLAGYRCRTLSDASKKQSWVVRGGNNEQLVGSAVQEPCLVDTTVRHFDYPAVIGCVESCPYIFPHQSYCHVAGDGRFPDRDVQQRYLADAFRDLVQNGPGTRLEQTTAMAMLNSTLSSMTGADVFEFLTKPDQNGRTPVIIVAMLGDVDLMQLLWNHTLNNKLFRARDIGGYTALMHSLQLGHASMTQWLLSKANASLAASDIPVLVDLDVDVSGIPVYALQDSPAYLGRGSLTWTGVRMTQINATPP